MSKMQRDKGAQFERDVRNAFVKAGFPEAERNLNDKTDGRGVDVEAGTLAIQCKRYKKMPSTSFIKEVKDGTRFPALVGRGDNEKATITLYLRDFLAIAQDVGLLYNYDPPPF